MGGGRDPGAADDRGGDMKRHYRNMTRQIADQIRDLYFSRWFRQHEIAEIYGIKQNSVSRIVSGQVWA